MMDLKNLCVHLISLMSCIEIDFIIDLSTLDNKWFKRHCCPTNRNLGFCNQNNQRKQRKRFFFVKLGMITSVHSGFILTN